MDENRELQRLIERAWSVHDMISHEIKSNVLFDQRQSLLHIRDSLKEVEDMLISLQRMRPRHQMDGEAAIGRLEESRAMLVEKVARYQEIGRELGVVEELNACFGNRDGLINWNLDEKRKKMMKKKRVESGSGGFVICCIKSVLNPWKWRKGFGVGMLVLATIACSVQARKWQLQRRSNSQTGTDLAISTRALHVFDGRG